MDWQAHRSECSCLILQIDNVEVGGALAHPPQVQPAPMPGNRVNCVLRGKVLCGLRALRGDDAHGMTAAGQLRGQNAGEVCDAAELWRKFAREQANLHGRVLQIAIDNKLRDRLQRNGSAAVGQVLQRGLPAARKFPRFVERTANGC